MTKLKKPEHQHLINLDMLTQNDLAYFIERANYFLESTMNKKELLPTLSGKVITALFFEPSTRTLNSFILAAHRLGAIILSPVLAYSAMTKGESLIDTAQSFEAMGTDLFIIRHADNHTPDFIANELTTDAHIINAGDGTNRHPTQALLDLMTIQQCKGDFSNLSVAIVGDINHSRVAKSLVVALSKMSVPDIRLVGPDTLVSDTLAQHNVSVYHNLTDGIKNADVVIALRIQKERFDEKEHLDLKCYQKEFCITQEIMSTARPDAIVMHPGPINRNLEIASDVADSSQSMILKQVTNGVAMRMALLDTLIGAK